MREAGGIRVGGMESNGVHAEVDHLDPVGPDAVRQHRFAHVLGHHRYQGRSAQRQAGPNTRPRRVVRRHEQIRSPRRDDIRMEPAEAGLPAVAGQVMAVQDVGPYAAKGDAQCSAPLQGADERQPTAPEARVPVHRDLAGEARPHDVIHADQEVDEVAARGEELDPATRVHAVGIGQVGEREGWRHERHDRQPSASPGARPRSRAAYHAIP